MYVEKAPSTHIDLDLDLGRKAKRKPGLLRPVRLRPDLLLFGINRAGFDVRSVKEFKVLTSRKKDLLLDLPHPLYVEEAAGKRFYKIAQYLLLASGLHSFYNSEDYHGRPAGDGGKDTLMDAVRRF